MQKRAIAIILALIMVFAFVGCGKSKKRKIVHLTLSTVDSQKIMAAAGIYLPEPEEAKGAGTTVVWFSWYDQFHNYSEDEIIHTGYYTFRERYNCEVEWLETDYFERNNDLANLVLTSNSPDFAPAGTSNTATFPMSCFNEMYQPVDDYIDYDDPLWAQMKDAAEYFSLGDRHFAMVYDLSFKDVVPYNKRVMEDYGFEDPAELFKNNEWTWDKFYEMCMDFSDPDEDRYALDGWYYTMAICEQSTGRYIIQKDENGKFYSNVDDPLIEIGENLIYDLVKAGCTYHVGNDYWKGRRDMEYGAGVKEGLCLFWICDKSGFTHTVEDINNVWGDIANEEIMFAPLPRYQDGDGIYYLNATPSGYMLCSGASNPEGVALLAACERFKVIDPTVVDIDKKQLKEVYLWSQDMLDMVDTCNQLVQENIRMFYTGDLPKAVNDAYNHFDWDICRSGASSTWAQLKERFSETLAYSIDELNYDVEEYELKLEELDSGAADTAE